MIDEQGILKIEGKVKTALETYQRLTGLNFPEERIIAALERRVQEISESLVLDFVQYFEADDLRNLIAYLVLRKKAKEEAGKINDRRKQK